MVLKRVIPCLLLSDNGLVKTVKFKDKTYVGDPINAVKIFNEKEVDGSDFTKPLFKIHNCFMDSFGVDYTTSSLVSFLDDDQPLTTTISMGFKETQLLTKKDIDEGY